MTPRVTVLSSVYNDAPFVAEAVESVLGQTFGDFEYLIFNDAAQDGSREIVASYHDPRIRIIDNETNLGLTKSLNRGLALARGELIARFDSNDVCFPERLAKQVVFLDAHPDVAAVGVQTTIIDRNGTRLRRAESRRPLSDTAIRWHCMFGTPLIHSAAMYRRSVVYGELGGYDEQFRVGQDGELWSRLLRRHKLANIDEQLMAVRFDPGSISGDPSLDVRAGFRERWTRLAMTNLRFVLERDDIPAEWPRLWVDVNAPGVAMTADETLRVKAMLDEAFARFCALHPDARHDRDVARNRAYLLQRAAEKAVPTSKRASMRLFAALSAADWRSAVAVLPRLAVMWTAGDVAVRAWRRWRHGRA